ncbi:MAG: hypothetical protein JSR96_11230 [Proteobacteria bacterium]|nr:hypothetical protein [Pseudomonadota bacterium]
MKASRTQLFLIFLDQGTPLSRHGVRYHLEKLFGKQEDFECLYPSLTELIRMEVIEEFDIETEGGVDSALYSHAEHGELQFDDFEAVFGIDEVLHLSRGAIAYAIEHTAELTDEAAKLGLPNALQSLISMPIDSTSWTGMPKGFVFSEQAKMQLVRLLDEASQALERSGLSNFEIGQGAAFLKSASILANAPEPPRNEIWSLINKGSAITGLASFFIPIVKFLAGIK